MSLKRKMAEHVGRLLGLYIVPKREAWIVAQRDFLERFFAAFRVDCVFDVGANEGQFASLIRSTGFRGPIVSFEPIPSLAAALRQKAKLDPAWFIEEIALDDAVRVTDFNIIAASSLSSMMKINPTLAEARPQTYRVLQTVSITTGILAGYFDSYRVKLGFHRPFLKLDTQGADLAVARGAGERLGDFVGLQSELSFLPLYSGQDDYRTAIDFFEQRGFELAAFLQFGYPMFPRLAETDCIMFNPRFVLK